MTFGPAHLPLQGVLVEPPADVDQDRGGAGIHRTAEDHVAHARGHVHPEPEDDPHQQTWRESRTFRKFNQTWAQTQISGVKQ